MRLHIRQLNLYDAARHLESIDDVLCEFALRHGLELAKNLGHRPTRILRLVQNPKHVLGIEHEGVWRDAEWRDKDPANTLMHSVGIASYFKVNERITITRRMMMCEHLHISMLQSEIAKLLADGFATLAAWGSPAIGTEGGYGEDWFEIYHPTKAEMQERLHNADKRARPTGEG